MPTGIPVLTGLDSEELDSLDSDTLTDNDWQELTRAASEFVGQFAPDRLLEHVLGHALSVLSCETGSIATVDAEQHTYTKRIDIGIECQSGQTFSLDEGVTGVVFRSKASVVLDSYADVPGGHLPMSARRETHGVVGVPIMWAGEIIGSVVVFSRDPDRAFSPRDVRFLEIIASHAATALTNARMHALATERASALAVAAERERLIRQVSDAIGRELASLRLHLETAGKTGATSPEVAQSLLRARLSADKALDEIRRMANSPSAPLLKERTLSEIFGLELVWVESRFGHRTDLVVAGEPYQLPQEISHHLVKMTQQAISNVAIHAEASLLRVGLVYEPEMFKIIVADDGCGFDASTVLARRDAERRRFGLQAMLERASHIGAEVVINSTPNWGTRLEIRVPWKETFGSARDRWRVLVVHPHALVRAGISQMLSSSEPDLQIVSEVGTIDDAVEAYQLLKPDVVVSGIHHLVSELPPLVSGLRNLDQDAAIILLSDAPNAEQATIASHLGIRGLIGRDVDADELIRAVIAAARGDSTVANPATGRRESGLGMQSKESTLSARETEVRRLVEQGLPDKQIATILGISVKTVEKHVGSVLRKTGARNRTMLAGLSTAHH